MEIAQVIHTFQSNFATSNYGGKFTFNMAQPIKGVVSGRIKSVTIRNFAAIANSPWYYLKTDAISNTRDANRYNGIPNLVVLTIPNIQKGAVGDPISQKNLSEDFIPCIKHDIHQIWFELMDITSTVINPADVGWMFSVEVEYKVCPC
jgi:hypothetical protein